MWTLALGSCPQILSMARDKLIRDLGQQLSCEAVNASPRSAMSRTLVSV